LVAEFHPLQVVLSAFPENVCLRGLRIFHRGRGKTIAIFSLVDADNAAGSTGMTKPHVYELNLKALKEPDDLWSRLFLDWLKSISEQHAMTVDRLGALEKAVLQLDRTISEQLPEKSEDLRHAMKAVEDVQEVWEQQLTRSLENLEKIAVIAKRIVATQNG
jgi:hypothetical protein